MSELDLSKLSPSDLRKYIRTGIYTPTIDDIQYLDTELNNDPNRFLNGVGELEHPTTGVTDNVLITNKRLSFINGILKIVENISTTLNITTFFDPTTTEYIPTTTEYTPTGPLELVFNNINSAGYMIGGNVDDVTIWNNFFGVSTFSSVNVNGNSIRLTGNKTIHLKDSLFFSNTNLLSIDDIGGYIITAGYDCFNYCTNLYNINLPKLITAGNTCFANCTSILSIALLSLTSIGNSGFYGSISLQLINLPSLTNLGNTFNNDGVFSGFNGSFVTLRIPSPLMTCNGGNPDGDISIFQANNTINLVYSDATTTEYVPTTTEYVPTTTEYVPTTTEYVPTTTEYVEDSSLQLSFDNLLSVGSLFEGAVEDVNNWNTFFGLEQNSYTSVSIELNNVYLYGNNNYLRVNLFKNFQHLLGIVDIGGKITNIGDNAFEGCTLLNTIYLPALNILGSNTGYNSVFTNIMENNISLTIPSALMTCNEGSPDGDIAYLQTNNTVDITTV